MCSFDCGSRHICCSSQSTRGAMGYLSKFPNWMESKQDWNERHGKPTSWRRTPPTCPTPSLGTILGLTTEFLRPRFTGSCLSSSTEEVPQRVLSSPLWKLALVFKVGQKLTKKARAGWLSTGLKSQHGPQTLGLLGYEFKANLGSIKRPCLRKLKSEEERKVACDEDKWCQEC